MLENQESIPETLRFLHEVAENSLVDTNFLNKIWKKSCQKTKKDIVANRLKSLKNNTKISA